MPASEFPEKLKGMFPHYLSNEKVSIDILTTIPRL